VLDVEGEPLAIRHQVCYSPSASILVRQVTSDRTPVGREALVVGDPGGNLPHARIEAVTVARQLGVIPVLGERVSKRLVLDKLFDREEPTRLVHIASHATMRAGTHGAGLVLGNGPSEGSHWLSEDVLTADDLHGAKLPAALVVLSCCATGRDGVRPGDELTGLVRSFLTAGAAAVVVSQWAVDDLSTSVLMNAFHRHVTQPGATLASALRDAAMQVRSMTRDELTEVAAGHLEGPPLDPAAIRMLRLDAAALADPSAFPRTRAALATNPDPVLRDAAVEAEDRYDAVQTASKGRQPFRHPNYWAPFVLIGDWRPTMAAATGADPAGEQRRTRTRRGSRS
jgi:CHAT domain-containing protein